MEYNTNTKHKKPTQYSKNWKHWITLRDLKTCKSCDTMHGKVFSLWDFLIFKPPLHLFCRCKIKPMEAISAGFATNDGTRGADYWLKNYKQLPAYYIKKNDARKLGWNAKQGNLSEILPGNQIGGDRYYNDDGHLPDTPGRLWYEADINYTGGYRGDGRLLYSNDGLIFVTYNHYQTYIEII